MKLKFTKMHGAGNDFIVIDGVRQAVSLTKEQWRFLANRHFGIGADQILLVQAASQKDVDFDYRIFNADGGEVEHCGNGARCFVRFVNEQGLSDKSTLRVKTVNGLLTLSRVDTSRVTVNMGQPIFEHSRIRFVPGELAAKVQSQETLWAFEPTTPSTVNMPVLAFAAVSMGNPHAVVQIESLANFPVAQMGAEVQASEFFPDGVNVGFMQILSRHQIALRVFERGVGETIACGTGACAAVVSGIRRGLLDQKVKVFTRGGTLEIDWQVNRLFDRSSEQATEPLTSGDVFLTGPTQTVFTGEINIPEHLKEFDEQSIP